MDEDIDWNEETLSFDAGAANIETRIMWLKLARQFSAIAGGFNDFLDGPKDAASAMGWAARAEACMWRATGDTDTIDADRFIPEIRDSDGNPQGEDANAASGEA